MVTRGGGRSGHCGRYRLVRDRGGALNSHSRRDGLSQSIELRPSSSLCLPGFCCGRTCGQADGKRFGGELVRRSWMPSPGRCFGGVAALSLHALPYVRYGDFTPVVLRDAFWSLMASFFWSPFLPRRLCVKAVCGGYSIATSEVSATIDDRARWITSRSNGSRQHLPHSSPETETREASLTTTACAWTGRLRRASRSI